MSLHINIPKIAITPEDEDDDDDDKNLLNLSEALTDVEELFEDHVSSRRNSFRKKLKIKVTDNDGYNTALEDVEASDDDDSTPILVHHNSPISLDDIDMEQYSTEEKYGIAEKQLNSFEYLKLQSSNSNETLLSTRVELLEGSPLTDVEDYDTENESEDDIHIPDSEIQVDNIDTLQIITISDDIQDRKKIETECNTPLTPAVFPCSLFEEQLIKPRRKPPTFSQMMRGKGNSGQVRMRKKKRNKINLRQFNGQKEISENDSSENELTKPKSHKHASLKNSLNYDSDVEEENKLQFPVCKKMFAKNKNHLKMPEFDLNVKTDVEDFECEADTYRRRQSVDSIIFQKQLDEMASCYSFTKDKNEVIQIKSDEKEKIKSSSLDESKYVRDYTEQKISKPAMQLFISPSPIEEGGLTDVENISDSQEYEKIYTNDLDLNSEYNTEEELFKGFPNDISFVPDIVLPPPTRTLVIAEENKSLIPTVRILPLDDSVEPYSELEEASTEDESMHSDTELTMRGRRDLHSPQLPIIEGENVKMSENSINPLHNKSTIEDVATDVEDLDGVTPRVKTNLQKRVFLSPNKSSVGYFTDLEVLAMGDCQSDGKLLVGSEIEGHTDLEYLDSSDEDSFSKTELQVNRKSSMKLKFPNTIPQGFTDTEELVASSDDEINYSRAETATPHEIKKELNEISSIHIDVENTSKIDYSAPEEVMYLKGGGFQEIHTDTEWFLEDAEPQFQDVMDAWEYFNQSDEVNASLNKEWNATEDSEKISRTQPASVGEDKSVSSVRRSVTIPSITYESILLPPNLKTGCSLDTNSYTQIDEMLEKMLTAVDQFNMSVDSHTNSITLEPSSDAMIEIPIKKSKSKKVYTATANIFVAENERQEQTENSMELYPNNDLNTDTSKTDDTEFSSSEYLDSFYKDDIFFCNNSNNYETENLYEPIDLKLSENSNDPDYVWWEGTYRNLSVVVEEDEDNYSVKDNNRTEIFKPHENKNNDVSVFCPQTSSENTDYGSESSQVFSSMSTEGSDSDLSDQMIKAEVKLMITSQEDGLDSIEVKSVKEFMLENDQKLEKVKNKIPKKKLKLKKKLINILDKRKSDSEIVSPMKSEKSEKKREIRPSFTIPRIFIKGSDSKVLSSDGRKIDIVAKPTDNFPLTMNQQEDSIKDQQTKVDLFANRPFYPMYSHKTDSCTSEPLNVTSYVPPSDVTISEAYCNWSSETENHGGKSTSTQYLIKLEEKLLDKTLDPPYVAYPNSGINNFTTKSNETNAFPEFEPEIGKSDTHHVRHSESSISYEPEIITINRESVYSIPEVADIQKIEEEPFSELISTEKSYKLPEEFNFEYSKFTTASFLEKEKNSHVWVDTKRISFEAEESEKNPKRTLVKFNLPPTRSTEETTIIEKQDSESSKESLDYSEKHEIKDYGNQEVNNDLVMENHNLINVTKYIHTEEKTQNQVRNPRFMELPQAEQKLYITAVEGNEEPIDDLKECEPNKKSDESLKLVQPVFEVNKEPEELYSTEYHKQKKQNQWNEKTGESKSQQMTIETHDASVTQAQGEKIDEIIERSFDQKAFTSTEKYTTVTENPRVNDEQQKTKEDTHSFLITEKENIEKDEHVLRMHGIKLTGVDDKVKISAVIEENKEQKEPIIKASDTHSVGMKMEDIHVGTRESLKKSEASDRINEIGDTALSQADKKSSKKHKSVFTSFFRGKSKEDDRSDKEQKKVIHDKYSKDNYIKLKEITIHFLTEEIEKYEDGINHQTHKPNEGKVIEMPLEIQTIKDGPNEVLEEPAMKPKKAVFTQKLKSDISFDDKQEKCPRENYSESQETTTQFLSHEKDKYEDGIYHASRVKIQDPNEKRVVDIQFENQKMKDGPDEIEGGSSEKIITNLSTEKSKKDLPSDNEQMPSVQGGAGSKENTIHFLSREKGEYEDEMNLSNKVKIKGPNEEQVIPLGNQKKEGKPKIIKEESSTKTSSRSFFAGSKKESPVDNERVQEENSAESRGITTNFLTQEKEKYEDGIYHATDVQIQDLIEKQAIVTPQKNEKYEERMNLGGNIQIQELNEEQVMNISLETQKKQDEPDKIKKEPSRKAVFATSKNEDPSDNELYFLREDADSKEFYSEQKYKDIYHAKRVQIQEPKEKQVIDMRLQNQENKPDEEGGSSKKTVITDLSAKKSQKDQLSDNERQCLIRGDTDSKEHYAKSKDTTIHFLSQEKNKYEDGRYLPSKLQIKETDNEQVINVPLENQKKKEEPDKIKDKSSKTEIPIDNHQHFIQEDNYKESKKVTTNFLSREKEKYEDGKYHASKVQILELKEKQVIDTAQEIKKYEERINSTEKTQIQELIEVQTTNTPLENQKEKKEEPHKIKKESSIKTAVSSFFSEKSKKEDPGDNELKSVSKDQDPKKYYSESKNLTTNFLSQEKEKYEDGMYHEKIVRIQKQNGKFIETPLENQETIVEPKNKEGITEVFLSPEQICNTTNEFLNTELRNYHDDKYHEVIETESEHLKGQKHKKEINKDKTIPLDLSQNKEKRIIINSGKIQKEENVRIPKRADDEAAVKIDENLRGTVVNDSISKENTAPPKKREKSSIFKIFKGKSKKDNKTNTESNEVLVPTEHKHTENNYSLMKENTFAFLKTEIEEYEDGLGLKDKENNKMTPAATKLVHNLDEYNGDQNKDELYLSSKESIENTSEFLSSEINKYHDVKYFQPSGITGGHKREEKIETIEINQECNRAELGNMIDKTEQPSMSGKTSKENKKLAKKPFFKKKSMNESGDESKTENDDEKSKKFEDNQVMQQKLGDSGRREWTKTNKSDDSEHNENVTNQSPIDLQKLSSDFLNTELKAYQDAKYSKGTESETEQMKNRTENELESRKLLKLDTDAPSDSRNSLESYNLKRMEEIKPSETTDGNIGIGNRQISQESRESSEKQKKSANFQGFVKDNSKKQSQSINNMAEIHERENLEKLKQTSAYFLLKEKETYEDGGHTVEFEKSEDLPILYQAEKEIITFEKEKPTDTMKKDDTSQDKSINTNYSFIETNKFSTEFLEKEIKFYHDVKCFDLKADSQNNEKAQHSRIDIVSGATEMRDNRASKETRKHSKKHEKSGFMGMFSRKPKQKTNSDSKDLSQKDETFEEMKEQDQKKANIGKQRIEVENKENEQSDTPPYLLTSEFLSTEIKNYQNGKYLEIETQSEPKKSVITQNEETRSIFEPLSISEERYNTEKEPEKNKISSKYTSEISSATEDVTSDKSTESPKPAKKEERTGILKYFKSKLKRGSSGESEAEENSTQAKHEKAYSELKKETLSFLLKEKEKYEDSRCEVLKDRIDYESKISSDRKPIEPSLHKPEEQKSEQALLEECTAIKQIKKLSRANTGRNENLEMPSQVESAILSQEVISITRSFLEIEKNIDCDTTNANIIRVLDSRYENFETHTNDNEDKLKVQRETFNSNDPDGLSSCSNIQATTDFLILEKQLYDTAQDNEKIKNQVLLETGSKKEFLETEQKRIKPVNGSQMAVISKTPSDDLKSKVISTSSDKIATENGQNEHAGIQMKTNKKRGILGFLKKKSKETNDGSNQDTKSLDTQIQQKREESTIVNMKKVTPLEIATPSTDIEKPHDLTEEVENAKKSGKTSESSVKKKLKSHKKAPSEEEITESKKGILGFLFKKKKPKNKEETSTCSYYKAEDFLKILEDTKTFLNKETEMYHDMRDSSSSGNSNETNQNIDAETHPEPLNFTENVDERNIFKNTSTFIQNEINNYYDNRSRTHSEITEDEFYVSVPEYTAFDFIKEEIKTFEATKLPNTSKVDSSIRIETEVETIDGDSPKEIITKKIIISEKLMEMNDVLESDTSREILKKLMEVNKDFKAQLNINKLETSKLDKPEITTMYKTVDEDISKSDVHQIESFITENINHGDNINTNLHDLTTTESQKPEKVQENIENILKIRDVELAKSNFVEDVSLFEGTIDALKNKKQEVVTDLDDITSDELSSVDSQNAEEIEKILRDKYQEYSDERMAIIEENIVKEQTENNIQFPQTSERMKLTSALENQSCESSNECSPNKKAIITKLNEKVGTLSEVKQVPENFVTDLKIEYSPYKKEPKGHQYDTMNQETTPFEESETTTVNTKRKPIFRIESEEEHFVTYTEVDATIPMNEELDNLLRELKMGNSEDQFVDIKSKENIDLKEGKPSQSAQADIDTIEKKLRDLGNALDTLEQLHETEPTEKNEVREKKLRRVERKFERMASETDELATISKRTVELSKPAENEQYQQLVSQLSQDEVMSFQGDYNNLWDEYTFSKSDEWDSKTPDSQADVLELPQGDIVYMAPVKLNKNQSVSKAGIEVDVIPIMPSPHVSPKLKKNRKCYSSTKYYDESQRHISASLEDHPKSYLQESITKKILQINPRRFLSGCSINEGNYSCPNEELWITKSLNNISTPSKRPIMDAVVGWLTSPTRKRSRIKSEYEESDSNKELNDINKLLERNRTQNDNLRITTPVDKQNIPLSINYIDTSCKQLTDASQKFPTNNQPPQPRPRHQKSKEQNDDPVKETAETLAKQISPVRDDLLDENDKTEDISYQDKKKFWENITKEPSKKQSDIIAHSKRNSIQETSAPPIPKPRGTLQVSYSVAETTTEKVSLMETKNDTEIIISEDHILDPIDPHEKIKICENIDQKPISTDLQLKKMEHPQDVEDSSKEVHKSDSVETDTEDPSSQGDNAGYISDSGDVEHYISDSEIEDRVPQIRERQMSVFIPPSVSQRTRFERSASLPTEDLYEVSARSTKLRKQYYEEQIKKEMIQEQLTIDLEDEGSPERKSIASPEMKSEEASQLFSKEIPTNERTELESVFEQNSEEDLPEEENNYVTSKNETTEVHVDKSETEKSEKLIEVHSEALSQQQNSQFDIQESIPEITFTLSGKQRRISEESDEYAVENEVEKISPVIEQEETAVSDSKDVIEEVHESVTPEILELSEQCRTKREIDEQSPEKICKSDDINVELNVFSKITEQSDFKQEVKTSEDSHHEMKSEIEYSEEEMQHSISENKKITKLDKKEISSEEVHTSKVIKNLEGFAVEQENVDKTSKIPVISREKVKTSPKIDKETSSETRFVSEKPTASSTEDIHPTVISEPSGSTHDEKKISGENTEDLSDIDLESEDLKLIVSRLENMHKIRKLKGFSKLPRKIKTSESASKIEQAETSTISSVEIKTSQEIGDDALSKTKTTSEEQIVCQPEVSIIEKSETPMKSLKDIKISEEIDDRDLSQIETISKEFNEMDSRTDIDDIKESVSSLEAREEIKISEEIHDRASSQIEGTDERLLDSHPEVDQIKKLKTLRKSLEGIESEHFDDQSSPHVKTTESEVKQVDSQPEVYIPKLSETPTKSSKETKTTEEVHAKSKLKMETTSEELKQTETEFNHEVHQIKQSETQEKSLKDIEVSEEIHDQELSQIEPTEEEPMKDSKLEIDKVKISGSKLPEKIEILKDILDETSSDFKSKEIEFKQVTHEPEKNLDVKRIETSTESLGEIKISEDIDEQKSRTEVDFKIEKSRTEMEKKISTDYEMEEIHTIKSSETSRYPELSSDIVKSAYEKTSESYTVINQPKENIENTIWEVSVESEMLKEEKLTTLPSTCKRESIDTRSDSASDKINDKYLDENTTDETNLESEKFDQEPSDSLPSTKLEFDEHDDMKKIILESLHQQKVDPEEAKLIAESLIEEIELEIQKVENFNRGLSSKSESLDSEKHVTDYLKELAEAKGLDQREVELVESVLERRQRQISKLSRGDTQASSMEITDEDLRHSEADYDYSNVLQQQMGQLEAEYSDHLKNVYDSLVEDQSTIDITSNDTPSSKTSGDNQNIIDTKEHTIKDEQVKSEKSYMQSKDIILEEDENVTESITDELDSNEIKPQTEDSSKLQQLETEASVSNDNDQIIDNKDEIEQQASSDVNLEDTTADQNKQDAIISNVAQEICTIQEQNVNHVKTVDVGNEELHTLKADIQSEEMQQNAGERISDEPEQSDEKEDSKESIKRTSSSDSKSSIGSSKTPDDLYSTCSSSKKIDSETSTEVVFRKSKKHDESSIRKIDRKSGIDLETYSSSGESHYHSFEIDSKSRPCSSDLEGILPTGSSEYESALNSQELSMRSQVTSGEYHTAISSLSSKESMMSIESESSGNLASIEVSETSETLVPTNSDLEADIDIVDQQMFEDGELWPTTSEFENNEFTSEDQSNQLSSMPPLTDSVDIPSKMKRSYEMTFQPEPKILATDSPHTESNDIDEKFGTSLDDGSALSVSLSSTSSAQLRTVIELSRTESGGPEESLTSAFSDHFSIEDGDLLTKTSENIVFTDSSTSTYAVSKEPIESVTILSATITTNGISSVCSQVITETTSSTDSQKSNHEELKKKGHRRQESTSFIPSLIHGVVKSSEPPTLLEDEQEPVTEISNEKFEKGYDKSMDLSIRREPTERRDSHGKSSGTSSEKSSFEEAEAEAAFNMVAHISPVHKIKQICPIIEDVDAEKTESEAKERAEKERIERANQIKDASPGSIPDIKVTEHMAPLDESKFRYPELEIERKELEQENRKSQDTETPHSDEPEAINQYNYETEDVISADTDSLEDNVNETKKEVPIKKGETTGDVASVEKSMNEEERASDSPNSDSFELVEKPDIIDDFVVIEEIGKEASEMDSEGKSMAIQAKPKSHRKRDEEIDAYLARSDPTPLTKMTELKYFPETNYELEFEFEDSPPQTKGDAATKDYGSRYDQELEANRKWIEQQFHGDHAAMSAAGYGYEMEFERGPLEDIKEEDINDIEASSRIGSLGSQKESGGSLGSIKDSYSSTPEYDVLAGRRYFTRSGEHDDISMSSLQEFENLERAMSLETKRIYHGSGSQESSSNGSFKTRYYTSKGDDISASSLKEFEGLEEACIAVYKTEVKVKEEEELLSQIEEVKERLPNEVEKTEKDDTEKSKVTESDEEDYEKRMFEIDEIIRQAQNNVERFIDLKEPEKTESLGRGDSIEEVSKVPDLDLDAPLNKPTAQTSYKDDDPMVTSTDSLDIEQSKPLQYGSTDSLDQKNVGADVMTASTDSIEFNNQLSKNITTDSIENKTDGSNMVCSDSLDIAAAVSTRPQMDSLEEDEPRIFADHSSSDTGKDLSSSTRDDADEQLHELMLGSTDSLEPTSSTATHATYQYETDSVFSGSFTSGGSNTMVSSTDTIDPHMAKECVDIAAAVRKVWFEEGTTSSGRNITTEFFEESSMPYVTEVIEPSDDPAFSHTIHRRVQMPVEIRKVTFHGGDADEKLEQFIKDFGENEEQIHETEEIDVDGNIHTRRIVQKRFVVRSGDDAANLSKAIHTEDSFNISQQFEMCPPQLTTLTKSITGETSQSSEPPDTISSKAQAFRRRPLRYDISVDDQTEVDPREHDWLFNLNKDGQQELSSEKGDGQVRQQPVDQHQLSSEMKELLKEMEEASKK